MMDCDIDQMFVISGAATITVESTGNLVVFNSTSRALKRIDEADLAILRQFGTPRSLRQAGEQLFEQLRLPVPAIGNRIRALLDANILIPVEGVGALARSGFASISIHHRMLKDYVRVAAYRSAIFKHAASKHVLEIGCGTGILSIFAAQAGASKVSAIEESLIGSLAEQMFRANEAPVRLYRGSSRDITLDEPADLLVHELVGADPYWHNVLWYIADAKRRLLKPGGQLLPCRIDALCVGLEAEAVPSILERTRLEAREFGELYQVRFDPYLKALDELEEVDETLDIPRFVSNQPILTKECLLKSIDLRTDFEPDMAKRECHELEVTTGGRLGSVLVYFRLYLDDNHTLTTSPFAPRTNWRLNIRDLPRAMSVTAGNKVSLFSELVENNGRQRLRVGLA